MSTLGVAGPITTTGSSIGNVAAGPLAMSHSILSKDESLEHYGPPLKQDLTPPIIQSKANLN